MSEVVLQVYDLSMGMASQLSPALLGKHIELIPHTGVVVFGREFFFGGGIQEMNHADVVATFGLRPSQALPMGTTTKSREEFLAFLRTISPRFTVATYDLFHHNCNNFSDEVTKFLLGTGIPKHIIDLPGEVLSTPIGAMLAPMLTNMQTTMAGQPHDPFTAMAGGAAPPPSTLGAPAPVAAAPPAAASPPPTALSKPWRPLLSADTRSLAPVVSRLVKHNDGLLAAGDASALPAASMEAVQASLVSLQAGSEDPGLSVDWDAVLSAANTMLASWPSVAFPVLCFVRVLVLREAGNEYFALGEGNPALAAALDTVPGSTSKPAFLMLMATLSNLAHHDAGKALILSRLATVCDLGLAHLRSDRADVRQMAAAVLHNVAFVMPPAGDSDDLTDASVQLIGGVFEGLTEEADAVACQRRLLTAGRMLATGGATLKDLATALGFKDVAQAVAATGSTPAVQALAGEVAALL